MYTLKIRASYTNKFVPACNTRLVQSGDDYFFTLKKMIEGAQKTIHFQTYIFDPDETGIPVIEALKQASQRGVKVNLIVDAFGSQKLSEDVINDMTRSGILFRFFSPLFSGEAKYFSRRLHHKIITTDNKSAMVGGINIANKYSGYNETAWLDYAVYTEGNIASKLHSLCNGYWKRKLRLPLLTQQTDQSNIVSLVKYSINDFIKRHYQIARSYRRAIRSAEKELIIVGSYFLPGYRYRKLLKRAAKRGVEIKIILSGVMDVPLIPRASFFLYNFLIKNKIKVYEWKHSVLHGKVIIADEEWISIGSYNMNTLSDIRSIEANLEFIDTSFSKQSKQHLEKDIFPKCELVSEEIYPKKFSLFERFLNRMAYLITKIGLRLFFIRTRQQE